MNNQIPYFMNPQDNINNQFPNHNNNSFPNIEFEKIIYKLNRLEKNLRILENRITKLESNSNNNLFNDDPTDMYII